MFWSNVRAEKLEADRYSGRSGKGLPLPVLYNNLPLFRFPLRHLIVHVRKSTVSGRSATLYSGVPHLRQHHYHLDQGLCKRCENATLLSGACDIVAMATQENGVHRVRGCGQHENETANLGPKSQGCL